jgi:diguanylate cyclase (GGDEF)-like protein
MPASPPASQQDRGAPPAAGPGLPRADALNEQAWALRYGKPERARELAEQALELSREAGYARGEGLALRTLGVHRFFARAEYDRAAAELGAALGLLEGERGEGDVLNALGSLHWRRGEYAEALGCHERALARQRASGDRAGEAFSLNGLGNVAYQLGDYGQALDHYLASLNVAQEAGDRLGVGFAHNNIGNIHGQLGDSSRALEHLLLAMKAKEGVDPHGAAIAVLNIATAYAEMGDDERAEAYLELAAERLRESGGRVAEAACLRDLGRIRERRGEAEAARELYRRSLAISLEVGAPACEAESRIRLGSLLVRGGEAAAAEAELRAALEIASARGLRPQVYAAHESLAAAREAAGDPSGALAHHRAFHAAWREVFNAETSARIKSVMLRAEVERSRGEAEILRQKNEELTAAHDEKTVLLERLREQAAELERQTREDALTGVSNRRHLDEVLASEWERALRFGRALSLALIDADHFKEVNDRFSHAVGDEVLRVLGRILRESTRGVDLVARYGGEEFCLLLVETPRRAALRLCETLRARVAEHDWGALAPGLSLTVSIGVAGHLEAREPAALLAAADLRMYSAKRDGRNRVCG